MMDCGYQEPQSREETKGQVTCDRLQVSRGQANPISFSSLGVYHLQKLLLAASTLSGLPIIPKIIVTNWERHRGQANVKSSVEDGNRRWQPAARRHQEEPGCPWGPPHPGGEASHLHSSLPGRR